MFAAVRWASPSIPAIGEGAVAAGRLRGERRPLGGLVAASLVLIPASVPYAASGTGAWGLSCGVISLVIAIALLMGAGERLGPNPNMAVAGLLLIMWICAAGVLTFKGPFLSTGNGYFSAWFGLIFSLYYMTFAHEKTGGDA